jgi:hypothetical protein
LKSTLEARRDLALGKEILEGISMINAQLEDGESLLLPRGCWSQMSEERTATRQGFFSRVFWENGRREGTKMTTLSFRIPVRRPISTSNLRGRSPPRWVLDMLAFVHPNRKESSEWQRYRC